MTPRNYYYKPMAGTPLNLERLTLTLFRRIEQVESAFPPGYVRCCCSAHAGRVLTLEDYRTIHP